MSILVTGFGPFRGHAENPSATLAASLGLQFEILDVQYGKVETFSRSIADRSATAILCFGLNARASDLRFELYAHNHIGSERGFGAKQHSRTMIRKSGPKTLGQTLADPEQLKSLPMSPCYTPGNYLCNFLLYSLLIRYPERRIGFVHVPLFETVEFENQRKQLVEFLQHLDLG